MPKNKGGSLPTITARYLGDLRVECTHVASQQKIITDAPLDNHGKGEAFSPTDLCCAALGACAMTIMGIEAQKHDMNITGSSMEITKTMSQDPRRIAKVEIAYYLGGSFRLDQKMLLQRAAENCPVCLSLGPETEIVFTFNWLE